MQLDYPAYATLRSIAICAVRHGFADRVNQVLPPVGPAFVSGNFLGEHASALSKRIFGTSVLSDRLITEHSHFPVVGRLLSDDDEINRRSQLAAGHPDGLAFVTRLRASQAFESTSLRRCPQCVEEDVTAHGVAHWRTFHQWPLVRHCLKHATQLEQLVVDPESVHRELLALPHDVAGTHGIGAFEPIALEDYVAYWPMLRALSEMLFEAECDGYRMSSRRQSITEARVFWLDRGEDTHPLRRAAAAFGCTSTAAFAAKLGGMYLPHQNSDDMQAANAISPMLVIAVTVAARALSAPVGDRHFLSAP